MAEEEEFGLDTQAIMWRTGFLFYGYLLLLCLIAAPWVVFACRSRYAVLHLEWTCRGCKQNYTGRRARRRTCRACGKRRHFVNKAPLWIACICAPLCLYGGALLFWGGLMYRFRGRLDRAVTVPFLLPTMKLLENQLYPRKIPSSPKAPTLPCGACFGPFVGNL